MILSAVQKNLGLLALIDEESRFPQASDQSLATKLHNTHSNNTSGVVLELHWRNAPHTEWNGILSSLSTYQVYRTEMDASIQ